MRPLPRRNPIPELAWQRRRREPACDQFGDDWPEIFKSRAAERDMPAWLRPEPDGWLTRLGKRLDAARVRRDRARITKLLLTPWDGVRRLNVLPDGSLTFLRPSKLFRGITPHSFILSRVGLSLAIWLPGWCHLPGIERCRIISHAFGQLHEEPPLTWRELARLANPFRRTGGGARS